MSKHVVVKVGGRAALHEVAPSRSPACASLPSLSKFFTSPQTFRTDTVF